MAHLQFFQHGMVGQEVAFAQGAQRLLSAGYTDEQLVLFATAVLHLGLINGQSSIDGAAAAQLSCQLMGLSTSAFDHRGRSRSTVQRGLVPHNIFAPIVVNVFTLHEYIITEMELNLLNALLLKAANYEVSIAMIRWGQARCRGPYDWDQAFPLLAKSEWTAARRGMPNAREAQKRYVVASARRWLASPAAPPQPPPHWDRRWKLYIMVREPARARPRRARAPPHTRRR